MIKKTIKKLINLFVKDDKSKALTEEEYYEYLFTQNVNYSKKEANEEENRRWTEIQKLLNRIPSVKQNTPIDLIVDFGCGRGWLTNYLSSFGRVIGIEPVEAVIKHGKLLYPDLELISGSFEQLRNFRPNLIVSSEVVEHIPKVDKQLYFNEIYDALLEEGYFLLTTPRQEVIKEWSKYTDPSQPVEDWLSGEEILMFAQNAGFSVVDSLVYAERPAITAPPIDVYQQWLFKKQ